MQSQSHSGITKKVRIDGVDIEVWESGKGKPLLLLHTGEGFNPADAYVQKLAAHHRVISPSHPGFGESGLPKHFKTVDDLSYFYLDFIDETGLGEVVLLGLSFGGWIAMEVAVKSCANISGLVLADSVGVKFQGPTTREIADLFSIPQYEQSSVLYEDKNLRNKSYADVADDILVKLARNHESFGLFGWSPTLHNPKLAARLHRIKVPTHLIWGAQDRVVSPEYGKRLAQAIPGASFEMIDQAGHYPQIEQADRFVSSVSRFTESLSDKRTKAAIQ